MLFIVVFYKLLPIMQKNVTFLFKSMCSGKHGVVQAQYNSDLAARRPNSSHDITDSERRDGACRSTQVLWWDSHGGNTSRSSIFKNAVSLWRKQLFFADKGSLRRSRGTLGHLQSQTGSLWIPELHRLQVVRV